MVLLRWRLVHDARLFQKYQKLCGIRLISTTKVVGESQNKVVRSDIQDSRLKLWEQLKIEHDERVQSKPTTPIQIRLKSGDIHEGVAYQTTPLSISKANDDGKIVNDGLVAKVNDQLWDLNRPLEGDCNVELLTFENPLAKQVFWRSSAHILGAAIERLHGNISCSGLATDVGFYYDALHGEQPASPRNNKYWDDELATLEKIMQHLIGKNEPFERIEVSRQHLLELFGQNKFKLQIIEKYLKGDKAVVYRCGPSIDIGDGPHMLNTKRIRAFKLFSSDVVTHDTTDDQVNRIGGISFMNKNQLKEWATEYAKAKDRDHRKIGHQQNLFFFHDYSPGSCFFKPKGAHIYNSLQNLIRTEYRKRGYQEVITPNIYKNKLWKQSGHWDYFKKNMFTFGEDQNEFALKPMNCPGHCLMFAHETRSFRELPLRLADFGVLHRDDTGLTGLTRVRRFQQDDAHIFCTTDQIQSEIDDTLDFLSHIYGIFGFHFELKLSTRPDEYLGDKSVWDKAESALENSLNKFGRPWGLSPKDGAFYGPKIDITIMDSLKREHQCATIQLDFVLPERFDLEYQTNQDTKERPVMIHRAMFGSLERFIAILIEHFGGRFPFFLSPNQMMVVPVDPHFNDYAQRVQKQLHNANFCVDADLDDRNRISKKVRNAQTNQYNFILVVGEKEISTNTVNVRTRDGTIHGEISVDDLIERLNKLRDNFGLNDNEF